jgi:hypothetical protein
MILLFGIRVLIETSHIPSPIDTRTISMIWRMRENIILLRALRVMLRSRVGLSSPSWMRRCDSIGPQGPYSSLCLCLIRMNRI